MSESSTQHNYLGRGCFLDFGGQRYRLGAGVGKRVDGLVRRKQRGTGFARIIQQRRCKSRTNESACQGNVCSPLGPFRFPSACRGPEGGGEEEQERGTPRTSATSRGAILGEKLDGHAKSTLRRSIRCHCCIHWRGRVDATGNRGFLGKVQTRAPWPVATVAGGSRGPHPESRGPRFDRTAEEQPGEANLGEQGRPLVPWPISTQTVPLSRVARF